MVSEPKDSSDVPRGRDATDERDRGRRRRRIVRWLRRRIDGPVLIVLLGVLSGLALRLIGTQFCLPMVHCHPDEHYLVNPALQVISTGDFNPKWFAYPTGYIYILAAVFVFTFLGGVSGGLWNSVRLVRPAPFHLAGRITTALLGTATLLAVYAGGKRILDRRSAAVAVLVLAVMPLHVTSSHFVTTDVPAAFFCALALVAAAAVARTGERRAYVLLGLFAGLAAGTKYNALLVAINLPVAHWANGKRAQLWDGNFIRGLLWIPLGFLIAVPYAVLDVPAFLDGLANEIAHYSRGHTGHEGELNRLFYGVFLAGRGVGPVAAALGIFGLVALFRRYERHKLLLVVFPVLYLLFIGSYKVRFVRNLMPVLPYLALWIGYGAVELLRQVQASWPALARVKTWKLALPGLLAIIAVPAALSVQDTIAWTTEDTRIEARRWIKENLPPGASIYLQSWSVDNLPKGQFRVSDDRFSWDYYVATDRLSRKYFDMKSSQPVKYHEVAEAFQHEAVAVFEGREENPFYCSASPTVLIFRRDPQRRGVRPPPPAPKQPRATR